MPSADPASGVASLHRDGDTLQLHGDLLAAAIAALWTPALAALAGVRTLDVAGVGRVDSAGVALLGELAARAGGASVVGNPAGLDALRAAYRLTPNLGYAD